MAQQNRKKLEFRIIAGELKGRKITSPDLGVTRPPLSRLRKAIFDFMSPHLEGARYLDLFSGTGSYLFEAVSRGVAKALGIEIERQLVDTINRQAARYGVSDRLACLCDDVLKALPGLAAQGCRYDLVLLAPPQYRGLVDAALHLLREYPLLARNGRIICQHDASETSRMDFSEFEIQQQRRYGNTTFTVLVEK